MLVRTRCHGHRCARTPPKVLRLTGARISSPKHEPKHDASQLVRNGDYRKYTYRLNKSQQSERHDKTSRHHECRQLGLCLQELIVYKVWPVPGLVSFGFLFFRRCPTSVHCSDVSQSIGVALSPRVSPSCALDSNKPKVRWTSQTFVFLITQNPPMMDFAPGMTSS